jgi:hypothetical protein
MRGTGKCYRRWRYRMRYRNCGRITALVILVSFWRSPVYGEPPTTPSRNSGENEMRLYSEFEVDALIDDLTKAALEAIEQAASEAAKAEALASLEREAAALAEAGRWQAQVSALTGEYRDLKKQSAKTAVITGVICLLSGLVIGSGTVFILRR